MLFLVISAPRRSKMTPELVEARLAFRQWIKSLKKQVASFYPRAGRGAVVIFDLGTRKDLTQMLRRWRTFVSARLDVYPLQEPAISETELRKKLRCLKEKE
ncbi:MAG: hypothetical protein A2078_02595 [Nitrospirae bacterium GWC2_57_9]|nr:MAG: hypothetical protein A2078_02595 [Nitrospirae bacterium GWC2_57_9]